MQATNSGIKLTAKPLSERVAALKLPLLIHKMNTTPIKGKEKIAVYKIKSVHPKERSG